MSRDVVSTEDEALLLDEISLAERLETLLVEFSDIEVG